MRYDPRWGVQNDLPRKYYVVVGYVVSGYFEELL